MHAIYYKYNLSSFSNIWLTNAQRDIDMDLRNANDFILQFVYRESFRRCPLYTPPFEWNKLGDIRYQPNRCTFKVTLLYDLLESTNV
jgi:hypothetical protein